MTATRPLPPKTALTEDGRDPQRIEPQVMSVLRKPLYEGTASPLPPLASAVHDGSPVGESPPAEYLAAWRAAGLVIGLGIVALIFLFYDTAAGAVSTWYNSGTYNHGFLILPICGYLVWLRRDRLVGIRPEPDYRGLVLILGCAFGWLIADFAGVRVVQEYALVGMIQALVFTVLGWPATRALIFPLFYLLFAVPVGDELIPIMQDWTAWFTVWALELVGVPVYLDGVFIQIPNGNFEVAEACAGVRFLIATVALGFLYAALTYRALWRRVLFVVLSFVVPVVANWLRAFGIVMIAHLTDNEYAVGVDHLIYGWIFFAVVTVLLLMIGMTFRDDHAPEPKPASRPAGPTARASLRRHGFAAAAVVVLAATAPAYAALTEATRHPAVPSLTVPRTGGGWQLLAVDREPWRPTFPEATAELFHAYRNSGQTIYLYIAYYPHQTKDAEVISYHNSVVGNQWQRASGAAMRAVLDGRPRDWAVTRLVRGERRRLAAQLYWIDGTFAGNPYYAKALQAKARLLGRPGAAAAVVIAADYMEDPAEAERAIAHFLGHLAPLGPMLAQAAGK